MKKKIENIMKLLTIDEKIRLFTGVDFWSTLDLPEKGLAKFLVADGPCGLRKQEGEADHLGINSSVPATAYPSGGTLAATWNRELIRREGDALGNEAKASKVDILLGPGVNIVRSPLCGRNFEYFSEDPYLAGEVATEYIIGVESTGTGSCIKHYAANNQETEREYINAVIDERALREIYLAAFEEPIKRGKPRAVMTALNKINGEYGAQNAYLINEILRKEWGYQGVVISDWFGIVDQVEALKNGMNLEMPYSEGVSENRLREALNTGKMTEEELDETIFWNIQAALIAEQNRDATSGFDPNKHHQLATEVAEEGIVLLKNHNRLLPLNDKMKIAVVGEFAEHPLIGLSVGSAKVLAHSIDNPLEEIQKRSNGLVLFAKGFEGNSINIGLIEEAVEKVQAADVGVVFLGIADGLEGEGKDRKSLKLPENQLVLLENLKKLQKNLIIVLNNGGAVTVEWQEGVTAILECFIAGEGMGTAITRILFGDVSPSGKLPVTIPEEIEQTPAFLSFPGNKETVIYDESIFVGYRYYDKRHLQPAYPFGHGLSYTTFSYGELKLDRNSMSDEDVLQVKCKIKNTGGFVGKEVVQLYVENFDSFVKKPIRELKGFEKVLLEPGEEKEVCFYLPKRAFAYYDVRFKEWIVDKGNYTIELASSSRDIRSTATIFITPKKIRYNWLTGWSTVEQLRQTPKGEEAFQEILSILNSCPYVDNSLRGMGIQLKNKEEGLDKLPLRYITLITQGVLDTIKLKELLDRCNYQE